MPKPDVGTITCPGCSTTQPLRITKNGKLYIACTEDGNLWFNTMKGQERLKKNGKLNPGVELKAAPKPASAPAPAAAAPKPPRQKPAQPADPKPADPAPADKTKTEDGGWLL